MAISKKVTSANVGSFVAGKSTNAVLATYAERTDAEKALLFSALAARVDRKAARKAAKAIAPVVVAAPTKVATKKAPAKRRTVRRTRKVAAATK